MSRPPLEVADLIRAAGDAFLERNRHWLQWKHIKVLLAILESLFESVDELAAKNFTQHFLGKKVVIS